MLLRYARSFILGLFVVQSGAMLQSSAVAESVGKVGAVNQHAAGTQPSASSAQVLSVGAAVVHKEKIETSGDGTAQMTFLDKSTLNVGRNSTVVIDKFIYNQSAGTGEMAASMSKGVMRFVGGQVSHTEGTTVKTPVATIGIRGGTVTILFRPHGHIIVIDQSGTIDVTNAVSHETIVRPGYAVEVDGLNQPIGAPFPVPPEILAEAMALLTSQPGQHGGVRKWPDDVMAARFGIGEGRLPNDPANTPGRDMIGIINTGDTFVTNRSQQQQTNGVVVVTAPVRRPPVVGTPPVVVATPPAP